MVSATTTQNTSAEIGSSEALRSRVKDLVTWVREGLYERDDTVRIAVLAVLAGQNIFLYGPPGTAKSMLSEKLTGMFRGARIYEHLMHRFCTPEELFGPVSLAGLKNDIYQRKIEGYLADAEFAFLDEIWKASPAVLNTLLTLLNEHTFHNGSQVVKVPLHSMITASNEIPDDDAGLSALYDRFMVRLPVFPLSKEESFIDLLCGSNKNSGSSEVPEEQITPEEYNAWLASFKKTELDPDTARVLAGIKKAVSAAAYRMKADALEPHAAVTAEPGKEVQLSYISDRRYVQMADFLRAAAFFNGNDKVYPRDTYLLRRIMWNKPEEQKSFTKALDNSLAAVLKSELESGEAGRLHSGSTRISETLKRYSTKNYFQSCGVDAGVDTEGNVWFRLLHDAGLVYPGLKDMWQNFHPSTGALGDVYAPGIAAKIRNPKNKPKAGFTPVPGDIVRVQIFRDINGYFTDLEKIGTETFNFNIQGLRRHDGEDMSLEKFTCKVSRLPKKIQLWFKNSLEVETDLIAKVLDMPRHFGIDKVMTASIRICFDGIFNEEVTDIGLPLRDTSLAVSSDKMPARDENEGDRLITGGFLAQNGVQLYQVLMENNDHVICADQDGAEPMKGSSLTYRNRFINGSFVYVEEKTLKDAFQHRVREIGLKDQSEIVASVVKLHSGKKIVLFAGLECLTDKESPIPDDADTIRLRITGIDNDRALIMTSAVTCMDITGCWLPFDQIKAGQPAKLMDSSFRNIGCCAAKRETDGQIDLMVKSGDVSRITVIPDKSMNAVAEFAHALTEVRDLVSSSHDLAENVVNVLNAENEGISRNIFLSDKDKEELTGLYEREFAPFLAECSRTSENEENFSVLWQKSLLTPSDHEIRYVEIAEPESMKYHDCSVENNVDSNAVKENESEDDEEEDVVKDPDAFTFEGTILKQNTGRTEENTLNSMSAAGEHEEEKPNTSSVLENIVGNNSVKDKLGFAEGKTGFGTEDCDVGFGAVEEQPKANPSLNASVSAEDRSASGTEQKNAEQENSFGSFGAAEPAVKQPFMSQGESALNGLLNRGKTADKTIDRIVFEEEKEFPKAKQSPKSGSTIANLLSKGSKIFK